MKLDFDIAGAIPADADYRSFRAILQARAAIRVLPATASPALDRGICSFTRAGIDRLFACDEQGKDGLNLCGSSFGEVGGVGTLQQPGGSAAGTVKTMQGGYA